MHTLTTKQLIYLALVVAVVGGVVIALFSLSYAPQQQAQTSTSVETPSPEIMEQLAKSNGFQYFISYTDTGFQPTQLIVNKGETVRFTNNSSHEVWIADTAYSAQSDCTDAVFNTCKELDPGDFWEYTFDTVGTIEYADMFNTQSMGSIEVK
jgi:plastocyanin